MEQIRLRYGAGSVGQRINEAELAEVLGVSRTPVHRVLQLLSDAGELSHEPRRGYVVLQPLDAGSATTEAPLLDDRMLRDIAGGQLVGTVSERSLMQRYGVTRGTLSSTLRLLMRDQLAEPTPGRGWVFVDIGPEALFESYRFRKIIEPAALLHDDYTVDTGLLHQLDAAHARAIDAYDSLDNRDLFELNSSFHLGLVRGANSRYLTDAMVRQNNIRRTAEIVSVHRNTRMQASLLEHREIIAHLLAGKRQSAARLMTLHLETSERETGGSFSAYLARPG